MKRRFVVFQDENRFSEMMWKKMRDNNCGATDHSISAGSLAGTSHVLRGCVEFRGFRGHTFPLFPHFYIRTLMKFIEVS